MGRWGPTSERAWRGAGVPANQETIRRHDYFAFGEDIEAPTGDPRRFTGKERDAETELHYFGARYYRSVWGRFTSPDPGQASGSPGDPQGWNAYAYARNNPVRFLDPDGLTYVVYGAYGGIATVADADWQSILRSPGRGYIVRGDKSGGTIWAMVNGTYVHAATYVWISQDAGRLEQFVGDIGRMASPGKDAAVAIALIGAVPMLASLAPPGSLTALGADVAGLMENQAINQAIGLVERRLLGQFFKTGRLPPGLTERALRLYKVLAERAIQMGKDTIGEQGRRLEMIREALKRFGG